MKPLLMRLPGPPRGVLPFTLDGHAHTGLEGDSVLTAVLTVGARLRVHEISGAPHAGLCGIGACQDCWMTLADGQRLRACSTPLQAGMALITRGSGDAR